MKVSIVTVSYNSVKNIEKTILSVVNQSYRDFEYIVIDGGSTDGTIDIIKKYEDKIGFWASEADKGLYNAMNKAVQKASGTWVNFMNCGDVFISNTVLEDIFNSNVSSDIICGIAITHDRYWLPVSPQDLSLHFFITDTINHQSAFVRKVLLLSSPFDETLKIASDTKFFFEMLIKHQVSYKPINIEVCKCEKPLVSNSRKESMNERIFAIKSYFPVRCQDSIEKLFYLYNPASLLISQLYNSVFVQKWVLKLLRPIKQIITSRKY